ncbi:hypothetical protein F5Y18DRAFT_421108 [Xylariaceae sp. FL1019]|nr:hypothetical protein F5Y18DRAFT_421108 [Xylariaceae sp. FL1019]
MAEEDVVLITQLPADSWFEGFAVRPDGTIIAARIDKAELYTVIPDEETPHLLYTFADEHNCVTNIGPIPGFDDEYIVLVSLANLEIVSQKDLWLYRLTVTGAGRDAVPTLKRLVEVTVQGYCLGVVPISDRVVLIPDAGNACIWRVDTVTGEKGIFAADESMKVVGEGAFFGINRIKVVDNYLYYTNTSSGSIGRIPVVTETEPQEVGIRTTGPVEIVIKDLPRHLEGLAVSSDQTHAYVASHLDGHLHKVTIDPATGKGTSQMILSSLDKPTGLNIAPSPGNPDKSTLYIICCGEIQVAWMIADKEDPWKAFRDLNDTTQYTVTQEVTETEQRLI